MLKLWGALTRPIFVVSDVVKKRERLFVYLLLFFISLLAFALRLWDCDKYPPILADKASDYLVSLHIVQGIEYPIAQGFYFGPIISYIRAFFIYVFGVSTFSAVLPAVIFGTLAVIAVFFLTKEMYDQRVALLACLLMAINPIAIGITHVSRFEDSMLFFSVLGMYFFWVVVEKGGKRWLLCFAGIFTGLALQSHPVSFIVIPVMFIYLIITRKLVKWLKDKYFWLAIILFLLAYSNIIYVNIESGMPLLKHWPSGFPRPVLFREDLNAQLIFETYSLHIHGTIVQGIVLFSELYSISGWSETLVGFLKLISIIIFLLSLALAIIKREKADIFILLLLTSALILSPLLLFYADYHFYSMLFPALAILSARLFKEILSHLKATFIKLKAGKLAPRSASKLATASFLLIAVLLYTSHLPFLIHDVYGRLEWGGESTDKFVEIVNFIKGSADPMSMIVVLSPWDVPTDLIPFLTNDQIQPVIINIKTAPDLFRFEMKNQIRDIYYIIYGRAVGVEELLRMVHPGIEPVYTVKNQRGLTLYSVYKVGGHNATLSAYFDQPEIYFDLFRAFFRSGLANAGLSELPKGYVGYNRFIALDASVNKEGFVEYYTTYFWKWGYWPLIDWSMNDFRITLTSGGQNSTYVLDSMSFPRQKVYLWNSSSNSFEEWGPESIFHLQDTTKIRILRYAPHMPLVVSTTFTIEPNKPHVISQIEIFNNDTETTYDIAFDMSISAHSYAHICSRGLFSHKNPTRIHIPSAYAFTEPLWSGGTRAFYPAGSATSFIAFGAYQSNDVISFASFSETPKGIYVSVSSQGEVQQSGINFRWRNVGPNSSVALTIILGGFMGDSTLDLDNDGVLDFLNTIGELTAP